MKVAEQVRSEVDGEDVLMDEAGAEFLADEGLADKPLTFPPAIAALGIEV